MLAWDHSKPIEMKEQARSNTNMASKRYNSVANLQLASGSDNAGRASNDVVVDEYTSSSQVSLLVAHRNEPTVSQNFEAGALAIDRAASKNMEHSLNNPSSGQIKKSSRVVRVLKHGSSGGAMIYKNQ